MNDLEKLGLISKLCEEALTYKAWGIEAMYRERSEALETIQRVIKDTHEVYFCPRCNSPYVYPKGEDIDVEVCVYCGEEVKQ